MRCVILPEGGSASVQLGYAEILAVHAALLHTGKILYFSGDEHDPGRHHLGLFDHARLFNCQTLAITGPAASPTIKDLFCCGHSFLADGRLLVGGGTEEWTIEEIGGDPHGHGAAGHFRGTPDVYSFDPISESWNPAARMIFEPGLSTGGGRWYPTLLTLGNGHVAAFSGHPSDADTRHFNNSIEAFDAAGGWSDLGTVPAPMGGYGDLTYYPRMHLLPEGKVFFSSPINGQSLKWDPTALAFTPVCAGPGNDYDGIGVTSVLLPLLAEEGHRPKVLMCGRPVSRVIDLGSGAPSWQPAGSRTLLDSGTPPVRTHNNAVILPTGEVAVVGGMGDPGNDPGSAVLDVELYRPSTNSWVTLPAPARCGVPRNYHSVALLMPDGRVWLCGSNIRANWSFHNAGDFPSSLPTDAQEGSVDNRERRIELFEPWYFGRSDRPTFTMSATAVSVGGSFTLTTVQALTISRVAVIRAASVTHSYSPDQRYVGLPFTRSAGILNVSVPDNENLLPPGFYMVFILNQVVDPMSGAVLDVPSLGHFLRIDNAKVYKELKWEIKEGKHEFKDLIKREVDIVKIPIEVPKLKDAEGDPFHFLGDPEFIRIMAERLDNLERAAPKAQAFIKSVERPPVRRTAAAQPERTPPPTPEELLMRDPHAHEGQPGGHTDAKHDSKRDPIRPRSHQKPGPMK